MIRFINLDQNKSEFICNRKLLSEYKNKPRVFIQTHDRQQVPYWEGDNIKKSHIKYFNQYCTNHNGVKVPNKLDDGSTTYIYDVIYYGHLRIRVFERISKFGNTIQLAIHKIYGWDTDSEINDIKNRFKVKVFPTGEEKIANPEYFNALIDILSEG